jgi:TIR domain
VSEVFVSYSQPDAGCAFELVTRIEAAGFSCWVAPRDIDPAADWAAAIIDAIAAARIMVLVLSANSNNSAQVRREVERAVHKQLNILPFRIEDVVPSKSLEYFLSAQHWMDAFTPPREGHYARLCAYLKAHFASSAASRPGSIEASGTYQAIAAKTQTFPADELHRIEIQLAGYIGPVARHLVKQAAGRASSLEDLIGRLAVELDVESERREFATSCRSAPAPKH